MFTLGCDPESFLINKDGNVVSAIGRIGGSKHEPKPILENYGKGYALQEDNVLLEYNIPPASSFSEFTDSIDIVHHYIDRLLADQELARAKIASHSMHPKEVEHPMAWVFGCEPDFNAWTLKVNPRPRCEDPLFRSAGGHIHIGIPNLSKSQSVAIVRWLDRYVGSYLLKHDPDDQRSKLYGAPGAMRFKEYGLEYRTPSNWWTFQPTNIIEEIYGYIRRAVERGMTGKINEVKVQGFGPEILESKEALRSWAGE